jgi:hypothetical protein
LRPHETTTYDEVEQITSHFTLERELLEREWFDGDSMLGERGTARTPKIERVRFTFPLVIARQIRRTMVRGRPISVALETSGAQQLARE